uniref:Uncharacterized protein n=1 Tax=Coccidioides posadasii RMSCC 3488 TaxID=454284 RepID=A0A0J6I7D2_COCPO|nr:hypothetical protein CPAG_03697 [Coccidioides posadasii RMSCC 3488]
MRSLAGPGVDGQDGPPALPARVLRYLKRDRSPAHNPYSWKDSRCSNQGFRYGQGSLKPSLQAQFLALRKARDGGAGIHVQVFPILQKPRHRVSSWKSESRT